MNLTTDKKLRKEQPMARGVLDYFKNAIADVARVSYVGNQQHNPGETMHWAREKSTDHADCIVRHLADRGTLDDDGLRHSAKAAWRALALLQLEIEAEPSLGPGYPYVVDLGASCAAKAGKVEHDPNAGKTENRAGPAHESPGVVGFEEAEAVKVAKYGGYFGIGNHEADTRRLFEIKCPAAIGRQILDGTSYAGHAANDLPYCYVAGPMRGIKDDNFPAFDNARDSLLEQGWNVISPADIDRATNHKIGEYENADVYFDRDINALRSLRPERGDAIAVLPGWEKSTGAPAEVFNARWRGLRIIDARTGKNLNYFKEAELCEYFVRTLMAQFGPQFSF